MGYIVKERIKPPCPAHVDPVRWDRDHDGWLIVNERTGKSISTHPTFKGACKLAKKWTDAGCVQFQGRIIDEG